MLRNCCTGRGFWLLLAILAFGGLILVISHSNSTTQTYSFSFQSLYNKIKSNKPYGGFHHHPKFNKYTDAAKSQSQQSHSGHHQPHESVERVKRPTNTNDGIKHSGTTKAKYDSKQDSIHKKPQPHLNRVKIFESNSNHHHEKHRQEHHHHQDHQRYQKHHHSYHHPHASTNRNQNTLLTSNDTIVSFFYLFSQRHQ